MRKIILYFLAPFFLLVAFALPDDDLNNFLQKFKDYHAQRPQEKLYLHFDKPLYVAGDDIWFKTYLVDASTHMNDTTHTVVYVELFSPEKKLLRRLVLPSSDGYSHGDLHLADTLPQGNYAVRSYTNYMKNQGEDFFFFKEITILNSDSARRSMPLSQNTLDVQFFPEGGNLIADVENRIAFKALNSLGKSEKVQGDIVDETGKTITTFKTDHAGMGLVRLSPIKGKRYQARVKDITGTESYFNLPQAEDGYRMRVANNSNQVQVIAYTNMNSSESSTVYLVAQSRGVICYAASGKLINNTLAAKIPKNAFPGGIAQITLFDNSFVPQCERLVFVNQDDNLTMDIKPDKDSFKKRTKVEIEISAIKKNDLPASGNFSLSVYDVGKMPEAQPYRLSIDNYLMLSSDLKGYIEDPGYYLKDTLKDTRYHLDLLMMTQGWRRFTWKEIMEPVASLPYKFEKGIVVSGSVERLMVKKPAPDSEIKILGTPGGLVFTKSDSLGNFYVDGFSYFDSTKLVIQTDNDKGKKTALQLKVDPFNPSPLLKQEIPALPSIEASSLVAQTVARNRILKTTNTDKEGIVLKEVEVKSTRIATNKNEQTKLYGTPDYSLRSTDMGNYPNAISVLHSKIPGVTFILIRDPKTGALRRSIRLSQTRGEPVFILDGRPLEREFATSIIESLSPSMIDHIDILKSMGNTMAYKGGDSGVIVVYTKQGNDIPATPDLAVHNLSYPGFTRVKEFYSPNYSSPPENEKVPDIRTTLYWNPSLQLDEEGKTKVSFYTSDVLSRYEVVVEGISEDGYPGVGKAEIRVVE